MGLPYNPILADIWSFYSQSNTANICQHSFFKTIKAANWLNVYYVREPSIVVHRAVWAKIKFEGDRMCNRIWCKGGSAKVQKYQMILLKGLTKFCTVFRENLEQKRKLLTWIVWLLTKLIGISINIKTGPVLRSIVGHSSRRYANLGSAKASSR